MDPKKQLSDLMKKPMSRKEFLSHVGATFLAVAGVSGLVKNLANPGGKQVVLSRKDNFGAGPYGGHKRT